MWEELSAHTFMGFRMGFLATCEQREKPINRLCSLPISSCRMAFLGPTKLNFLKNKKKSAINLI